VLFAVLNLLIGTGCVYIIVRALLLFEFPGRVASVVLGALLLLCEGFVMFQSFSYAMNVTAADSGVKPKRKEITDWTSAPAVAVLMPARHEPKEVLEETLTCLENLDYPNKTLYFLDDSTDESYRREAEELARKHGARIFRREVRHGAKAGIINDCIRTLKEKYIAVFDCDQRPLPQFLKELVPLMEGNDRLAYIQTPQFYTNIRKSRVAEAANLQHCLFYEYICEGKGASGAMICCGTNVLLRREALLQVGGFDESSVTEDFSTSVDFVSNGWQNLYYSHVCAFGEGPETLAPYLKQQWRWSRGNIGVLTKLLRLLLSRPLAMSPMQWWEFIATGSYYLIGCAYLVLMLCPIAYVFFGIPTFFMSPAIYSLTFVPYFCFAVAIFYMSMGRRYYSAGKLLKGLLLGFVALPVYVTAAAGAFLGLKAGFGITAKGKAADAYLPLWFFWPQILLWLLNVAALVWGVNRLLVAFDWSVLMCMVWIGYHTFLLSGVFYFRDVAAPAQEAAPQVA
jgi:cellulose synthase (UDP-forming)